MDESKSSPPNEDDMQAPPPPPPEDDMPPVPEVDSGYGHSSWMELEGMVHLPAGSAHEATDEKEEAQLLMNLRKAVQKLDKEAMESLLSKTLGMSDTVNFAPEVIEARDLCFGISPTEFLDRQIALASSKRKFKTLSQLLKEADAAHLQTPSVSSAKKQIQYLLNEKNKANTRPAVQREYIDEFRKFKEHSNEHKLYEALRSEGDFARQGTLLSRKVSAKDSMFEYQETPLHKSLVNYGSLPGAKSKAKALQDAAIDNFADLLAVMKMSKAKPAESVHKILQRGAIEPLLRDEIYLQIIKQTTEGFNMEAETRCLKILFLCLRCFKPIASKVEKSLLAHIASKANVTCSRFTGFDVAEEVAVHAYEAYLADELEEVPSVEIIRQFLEFGGNKIKITLQKAEKEEDFATMSNTNRLLRTASTSKRNVFSEDTETVVRVPKNIPIELMPIIPHSNEDTGTVAADLVIEASRQLRQPLLSNYLKLVFRGADEQLEPHAEVESIIKRIESRGPDISSKIQWVLAPTEMDFVDEDSDNEPESPVNSNAGASGSDVEFDMGPQSSAYTMVAPPILEGKANVEVSFSPLFFADESKDNRTNIPSFQPLQRQKEAFGTGTSSVEADQDGDEDDGDVFEKKKRKDLADVTPQKVNTPPPDAPAAPPPPAYDPNIANAEKSMNARVIEMRNKAKQLQQRSGKYTEEEIENNSNKKGEKIDTDTRLKERQEARRIKLQNHRKSVVKTRRDKRTTRVAE